MVYFSAPACGVCHVLRPKLEERFAENFPDIKLVHIDSSEHPDISAYFSVFTAPTVLVFLQGKEFARESRNLSVDHFIEKIRRPYEIMKS